MSALSGIDLTPGGPSDLRVVSLDLNRVDLAWSRGEWGDLDPDEYELSYEGTKPHYRAHTGTKRDITSTEFPFGGGRYGFTYCFKVRARFGDIWSHWSSELCDVQIPSLSGATSGRIKMLRVHRERGFGPPHDNIRANAVVQLDFESDMFFGFPIPFHNDAGAEVADPALLTPSGRVDQEWLDVLRDAYVNNQGVDIGYASTRGFNEIINYVQPVPPPRPVTHPWAQLQEGRKIQLAWIHSRDVAGKGARYTYEVHYKGTRGGHRNDEGTRTGIEFSEYEFEGRPGYTYCFRIRARNISGVSDWSSEVCADQIPTEPVEETVSVQGRLEPDIPHEGNVLYVHHFTPSGQDVRVLSIHVFGSDLDPWGAHFLPPDSPDPRADCGREDKGAIIWPGFTLEGRDMEKVYGTREPSAPLWIIACKVLRRPDTQIRPIPVEVTFRRIVD